MSKLESAWSSDFEFVFADAPYAGGVWIPDPPDRNEPTTDPDWASASIQYLDGLVQDQGPFYGILGYSQGAAFIPLYLSHAAAGSFQLAMLFNGYLPTNHLGLLATIRSGSPFGNIDSLVFMGANDLVISNEQTLEQAALFSSPVVITSSSAGHNLPDTSDPTFNDVVNFRHTISTMRKRWDADMEGMYSTRK
jgi:dienelactone hydrolase